MQNNAEGFQANLSSPENHHNLLSKGSLSPFMSGTPGCDLETSPYKSKFTVLKFTSPTKESPNKTDSPTKPFELSPVKVNLNNLFDEASNDSPYKHECAENQMPDIKRSPFFGFDEEQIMIPVTKQRVIAKNPYKVLDAPAL